MIYADIGECESCSMVFASEGLGGDLMSGGKKARLVLLLMIGLTAGAQAADSQKTYEYDRDQFSITLPAEWVEIPTTEITAFVDDLSKRAPEAPAQDYQYGFQLEESEYWFEYPYILIQIGREGRVNEDYLMGLKKLGNPNEEDRLNNAMKGVASNFSLEEAVYDPLKHIVWSRINAVLNDGRKVSAILGEVLAENGYILISLGCLSDRVDSYKDTNGVRLHSQIS